MPRTIRFTPTLNALTLLLALLLAVITILLNPALARTQSPDLTPTPRITTALIVTDIDDSIRTPLPASIHPLTRHAQDLGPIDPSEPTNRLLLLLKRSPSQEAALQQFIRSAHTPGDPAYHQWLTPSDFGHLYGPTDSDIAAIKGWLESHSLTVNQIHSGRNAIEFSGTSAQLAEAFQTSLHRYTYNNKTFLANSATPTIPSALAPAIFGLVSLTSIAPTSNLTTLGKADYNPRTHAAQPLWTVPTGTSTPSYAVAPIDFYAQYDLNTVYANNINGYSQWIAIVSGSNIDVTVVKDYQSIFSIPSFLPEVVVDGDDPGETDDLTEAYTDVELAISIAPRAKVLLYTSSGSAETPGIFLAAYRAVEDDVAGVISVSYGECESDLGISGNAFWSQLWQQAAAQGQTVFVSAGDSGSAGCDNFNTEYEAFNGLAVNGLASTPYNVAVGATDFYYSQFDGTSSALTAQLASYWSSTATAFPSLSLLQTIPEQPWNVSLGYNIITDLTSPSTWNILATGGGPSSAAISSGGYPKPTWQIGIGVPADGHRDIPDLSLFAGTNANYSYYPICASLVDCTGFTQSGAVIVTAVGGTSASAPAMAGIQTLVNQATGSWQGQADFVYYPLAAASPSVFHDVTNGQNTVLCDPDTANCVNSGEGFYVESGYQATTDYDLASGLGSVDVAKLINKWSTITFKPTITTLSLSSTNFVHGTSITATSSVTPKSGTGTPTGTIALTTIDGISRAGSFDAFALTGGTTSQLVDNLPGGTYYIASTYSGDGTYGASTSPYSTITVTPESDYILTSGWAVNPYDLNYYPLSAGITLPYGAGLFLDAEPVGENETIPTQLAAATGTLVFTDSAGPTSTQPLEVSGVAEWANGNFAPGTHSIGVSYAGDASYKSSNVNGAFTFTILKGSTILKLIPLATEVAPAGSVAVDVQLYTGYQPLLGTLPTGTVAVTLGNTTINASLSSYGTVGNAYLETVVNFTNLPAGILPLTATYAGDSNWLPSGANGGTVVALSYLLSPTVTLSPSTSTIIPGQTAAFTTTVTGASGKAIPTGSITLESDDQSYEATSALTIGASSSTATFNVPANSLLNGVNTLVAVYSGDTNYTPGASTPSTVDVNEADFRMTLLNTSVDIPAGSSATTTLVITPINGFSGPVSVTASAGVGLDIEFAAITPNITALYNDATTIYTTSGLSPWTYPVLISGIGGGHMHTVMIYVLAH